MTDLSAFATTSTAVSLLSIALGVTGPAVAMGLALFKALDSLGRQPEAEKAISRTLFIGLAMVESLAIYCLVVVLIVLFRNPLLPLVK